MLNRKATFAFSPASRMSLAIAMIAPAPAQIPSTAAMNGLGRGAHRLDEFAGHAGEGSEVAGVHPRERADDLEHVAAGGKIAAGRR